MQRAAEPLAAGMDLRRSTVVRREAWCFTSAGANAPVCVEQMAD